MNQDHENKIDIPERFFSDAEGKPFENCQVCGKYLLDDGTTYVVEKALKNYKEHDFYSTIFEYAICLECHMNIQQGMSAESMRNLQKYYMGSLADKGRHQMQINMKEFDLDSWLSKCFFTGNNIALFKRSI